MQGRFRIKCPTESAVAFAEGRFRTVTAESDPAEDRFRTSTGATESADGRRRTGTCTTEAAMARRVW